MNAKVKKLKKVNDSAIPNITYENLGLFMDMINYLSTSSITDYDQELVRQDLIEMTLSAQARGESIHSIIGDDVKQFCDNVIISLPPMTRKQKFIKFCKVYCLSFFALGLVKLFFMDEVLDLFSRFSFAELPSTRISIRIADFTHIFVFPFVIMLLVERPFKEETKKQHIVKLCLFGIVTACILVFIAWTANEIVCTLPIFVVLGILLCFYVVHEILDRM